MSSMILAALGTLLSMDPQIEAELSLPLSSLPLRSVFRLPYELTLYNAGLNPVSVGPEDWYNLVPEKRSDEATEWVACRQDPPGTQTMAREYWKTLPRKTVQPGQRYSFGFRKMAMCFVTKDDPRGRYEVRLNGSIVGEHLVTNTVNVELVEPKLADTDVFAGKIPGEFRPESALAVLDFLKFGSGLSRKDLTEFRPKLAFGRVWAPGHVLATGEVELARRLAVAKETYLAAHPNSPFADDVRVSAAEDWLAVGERAEALGLIERVLRSREAHPDVRATAEEIQRYLREHPEAASQRVEVPP